MSTNVMKEKKKVKNVKASRAETREAVRSPYTVNVFTE